MKALFGKSKRKSSGMGERNETPMNDSETEESMPSSYHSMDGHTEQAEDMLLSNLEAQGRRTRTMSDGFRPAIPGERAPFGVDSVGTALSDDDDTGPTPHTPPRDRQRPSFKQMVHRVQAMNSLARSASERSIQTRDSNQSEVSIAHRRARTLLESIDEKPNEDSDGHEMFTDLSSPNVFSSNLNPNMNHEGLHFLWNRHDEEEYLASEEAAESLSPEQRPLLGGDDGDGQDPHSMVTERRRLAQQRRQEIRMKRLLNCLNPITIVKKIFYVVFHSTLIVAIVFFCIAWILFYYVANPELDFLPGNATLSWWLNFFGRQLLLLELSRLTEFIVVDILTMSSRAVVQMLGPWITMFFLQSKGWPFLVFFWGFWDMILLHGDNKFQTHWLYWTDIDIYSTANSGSYILSSSAYLRVLIGMMLAGLATSIKRTSLTLYFGKRSFDIYKPQLEEILNDIIVITEIAELGAEASVLPDEGPLPDTKQLLEESVKKRGQLTQVRWSSLRFNKEDKKDAADATSESDDEMSAASNARKKSGEDPPPRSLLSRTARMNTSSSGSGLVKIKNLLDRWEEPVNKLDKASASSVNDILKFRKALTYMDLDNPFGESFGPASNRNELLKSAQLLYQRLLRLAPGSHGLPQSVLSVLSENEDRTIDKAVRKSINNLFPADSDGEIPLISFLQNCDVVYRRLRYFRASVGNSSVIDKVLERIIDGFFAFGLTVVILSLLNFNPWPLLVSVSTLLVSFAFAIGPTAAKSIEGIILIVGTRPFDIGDRIIIAQTPGLPSPGVGESWFVEDISLFSTTLRMAANNELATVSNGSIASTRITNCARSKNAVVVIPLKLHISVQTNRKFERFKDGLENYVSDNPAIWDMLIFLRCDDIDSDNEFVMCRLAVRSRHSWQVAARVLADRGRLFQFCIELAKRLEVNFESPNPRSILYYGGTLVNGAVQEFKKDLLADESNIQNRGDPSMMFASSHSLAPTAGPVTDRENTPAKDAADDLFLSMVHGAQNS
eukprot:scaffold543_cov119-Cylindrotheca_fusiformis.AAC.5